jgi:hypothetical protein
VLYNNHHFYINPKPFHKLSVLSIYRYYLPQLSAHCYLGKRKEEIMRSSKKLLSLLSKFEKQEYKTTGHSAVEILELLLRKAEYYQTRYKRLSDSYDVLNDIVREMMVKEVANSKKGGQ